MEKQQQSSKPKNKIMKFLPKAASAVYFRNPPFSPGRDKRIQEIHQHIYGVKPQVSKGFSGPIVSIIPDEVRRRTSKNGSYENQEPTSPKISCMGQIKHKKKIVNDKEKPSHNQETKHGDSIQKRHTSTIKRLLSNAVKAAEHGRKRSDACNYDKPPLTDTNPRALSLGQMKKFASGRDAFANLNWSSQVVPSDHKNDYSDHEEEGQSDQEYEEQVIVPFSAPIIVGPEIGNSKPRKEINIWQRRTMNPPKPLKLNG